MNTPEISTWWNGYCPESLLKGKTVRMRLNRHDFFESEETGLQICIIPGEQAVILNFRGKGDFRDTPSYGHELPDWEPDEYGTGLVLSPQNSDRVPFNEPTTVFESSEQLAAYIARVPIVR